MTETSEVTTYVNHAACQGYMVNTFYVLGAVLYLNVLYVEFFLHSIQIFLYTEIYTLLGHVFRYTSTI